jgi:pyruvate-formate lyase
MKRDGVSIQFNVFNAEMLRDAQQNPEKYKNLQVRISGWSILWNDLSKEEQDSYIIRAEGLGNG